MTDLVEAFEAFADLVAEKVEARLRRSTDDDVEQANSPLGPRRHVAAAKRRIIKGQPGVRRDGRKYFLSPDALREELARVHATSLEQDEPPEPPVIKAAAKDEMMARLRAVRGKP